MNQSGRKRKSIESDCSKIATSTGGITTDIGLSKIDPKIGQGPFARHVEIPLFGGMSVGAVLPPRKKFAAR